MWSGYNTQHPDKLLTNTRDITWLERGEPPLSEFVKFWKYIEFKNENLYENLCVGFQGMLLLLFK